MISKINWIFKNLHLIISVLIVLPTGIIYGSPTILPQHLDIQINTIDLSNMLKAIMGLYFGISFVWILGIYQDKYWKNATQLNILFMLTLGAGRVLSMILDGMPSEGYIFGVIAEFVLGFYALYQLKKYNKVLKENIV
jgi:hypothetical protein